MTSVFDEAVRLVRSVASPTPVEDRGELVPGYHVFLKREDLGPNGAFKWRGALSACAALRAEGAAGVVTSSTGNHGAAVAWAARRLAMDAHVVVPRDANARKRALIVSAGARLVEYGANLDEASARAKQIALELKVPYLEDGGNPAQILGTATIGLELARVEADAVIVPLGCGALAAGVAIALASSEPVPSIVGVQSVAFARFSALFHGKPDPLLPTAATIADGLAENRIVDPAFSVCRAHLTEIVAVDDRALIEAGRLLWREVGAIVEPAAAAPLAALTEYPGAVPGKRVVLVVSGANVNPGWVDLLEA